MRAPRRCARRVLRFAAITAFNSQDPTSNSQTYGRTLGSWELALDVGSSEIGRIVKPVHIIGVPLDLGAGRRGVDMGPSAFRIAGLSARLGELGRIVVDQGDVPAPIPETRHKADERKKYIHEIARVCETLVSRP